MQIHFRSIDKQVSKWVHTFQSKLLYRIGPECRIGSSFSLRNWEEPWDGAQLFLSPDPVGEPAKDTNITVISHYLMPIFQLDSFHYYISWEGLLHQSFVVEWATKSPQIQSPRFLKSCQTLFTWGLYLVRHHTPEEQNHKSRKYLWCYKFLIRIKSNMEGFPSLLQILSLVQNLPSQTIFP